MNDSKTGHLPTGRVHPTQDNVSHLSSPVPSESNLNSNATATHLIGTNRTLKSSSLTEQHRLSAENGAANSPGTDQDPTHKNGKSASEISPPPQGPQGTDGR
jgi:hypothetical protein